MSTLHKRKSSLHEQPIDGPTKRRFIESEAPIESESTSAPEVLVASTSPAAESSAPSQPTAESSSAPSSTLSRQERFKALQARQAASRKQNLKESTAEAQRAATNPELLNTLARKQAIASHKLLKADAAASGEDFERKRAWDWTVEESEKWDKRLAKKAAHRDEVVFQDYTQEARKVYKRQIRQMNVDLSAYEKAKLEAVERAVQSGGLEVVETEDGELIAVDKEGRFYSTAESTDFAQNKPSKEAVERLVAELQKAEELRLRNRRDRGKGDEDGDVTYINDKNKQFNDKLARFYNKYTSDIRDSFERGTAI
ncbi:SYF2-domain-containing protein [Patellaria atrata CBS 101060]|uniref:Pre-mRNA-splicing factor SYF2 n=1 Tax=Patellaria atrata CBS 101060 TaxID=1346257 RepID=A0A9P4VW46_9PEZI|nr:SYF2-domain-containing protein [Patellaria atrata CBS 101060]